MSRLCFILTKYICFELLNIFQAHEVLLAGRKLSAVEACNYGLVTQVFPHAQFDREVKKRMKHLVGLPPKVRLKKSGELIWHAELLV